MARKAGSGWLMLAFSLPMQPAYARVKIWRHLNAVGAVAIGKSGLYVLPRSGQMGDEFEWVLNEARSVGGEAVILDAQIIAGHTDEEIRALFRTQRDSEFQSVAEELRVLRASFGVRHGGPSVGEARAQLVRLAERAKSIAARDYFPSKTGIEVLELIDAIERALERRPRIPGKA